LLKLAYKLIKNNVPVYVKGRDIGEKLVSLVNDCVAVKKWTRVNGRNVPKMSVAGATTVQLHHALISWKNKQIEFIRSDDPDNETAIQGIEDRFDSLMVFVESNINGMVTSVIEQIERLFNDKDIEDMVVFSTVHKAKGLEASRVFMLSKECMYPWWVKKGTEDYQQEQHIDYVARTRAKVYYGYLPTNGWVD